MGVYIMFKGLGDIMRVGELAYIFLIIGIIVGVIKGLAILSRTAGRLVDRASTLDDSFRNYALGWLIVLGLPGVFLILGMIGLSIFLKLLLGVFNHPEFFGIIRIAVGSALVSGSLIFWHRLRQLCKQN